MNNNLENTDLLQQIADLKFKVKTLEEQNARIRKEGEKRLVAITSKLNIANMLAEHNTIYDDLPPSAKEDVIKILVDMELSKLDGEFFIDDKNRLDIRHPDGTNILTQNHHKMDPAAFLQSVLAKNKLLVETDDNQAANEGDKNNLKTKRNNTLKSMVNQAQVDWHTNTASPVM